MCYIYVLLYAYVTHDNVNVLRLRTTVRTCGQLADSVKRFFVMCSSHTHRYHLFIIWNRGHNIRNDIGPFLQKLLNSNIVSLSKLHISSHWSPPLIVTNNYLSAGRPLWSTLVILNEEATMVGNFCTDGRSTYIDSNICAAEFNFSQLQSKLNKLYFKRVFLQL